MAEQRDTIAVIAEELAFALQPLIGAFSSQAALRDFLEELGWDFSTVPAELEVIRAPADIALTLVESAEDSLNPSETKELLENVKSMFDAISKLRQAGGLPSDFRDEFPGQLAQYLLVEYLLQRYPRLGYLLRVMGIIRLEEEAASGARPAFLRRVFAFSDFQQLLSDPLVFFKNSYDWGQSGFKGETLLEYLHALLTAWGFNVYEHILDENTLNQLTSGALNPDGTFDTSLRLVFIEDSVDATRFNAGIGFYLLPETAGEKPGLAIQPFASGEFSKSFSLTDKLELSFEGETDFSGGMALIVRPERDIQFLAGFASGSASAISGTFALLLRLADPGSPLVLLGTPQASRLQAAGASTKGGIRFHTGGKYEVFTEFKLEEGRIIIKPGSDEADGFLAKLLPEDGLQIDFDLTAGFSSSRGLYFGGSGGLEINVPAHIQLGPLEILSALIAVRAEPASGSKPFRIPVDLAATFKADFSVLKGVVEDLGLSVDFKFPPEGDGNLGPLDLSFGFKPPNGVGLSVDAGAVKGGGYLYFDPDHERYAGALELVFSEFLTLKAVGLITTRLPDGSKGFSLLVIITAEFGSPIQLGFGFTLSGVGGLLGLNRTMRLQPLSQGVRTGSVNSVMFPDNVIENAPSIISDLRSFFPPQERIFLIGPLAKLGWGTPNLVTLSLGIIFEIPGNIAILGVLKVVLPDEKAALLVLQVNFIGAIEFDKKRAWFFASMFESRILYITIEGEMGLLVAWGNKANFVVSVGGFHPAFDPPPLPFPEPKRIAVSILNTSYAKIRVEGYFAVTSNTVQFGALAELFFGLSEFKIEGHLGFDALFQFSPFYMIIEISSSLSVKVFGIGLFSVRMRGSLEGPTPWHVEGTGSISLLFFDIDVDFSHTWGKEEDTTLPPIEVMPLLKAKLQRLENWKAKVPEENNILVSLRKLEESEELILHPVGTLEVSQQAIPLDLTLDKVGAKKPSDANRFALSVSGGTLQKIDDMQEPFAIAQFREMSDAQKLSAPAYEPQTSGLELSVEGDQLKSDTAVKRVVRFEQIIIDTNFKRFLRPFFNFFNVLFKLFLNGNATSRSRLSHHYRLQKRPFAEKISVRSPLYAVAVNSDNSAYSDTATNFSSKAGAEEFRQEQIKKDPNLAETLHVIPQTELKEAA